MYGLGNAAFDPRQAVDIFDKSAIPNQGRTVIVWRNLGGKRQREEQGKEGEIAAKAQFSSGLSVLVLVTFVPREVMFIIMIVGRVRAVFLRENSHAHRRQHCRLAPQVR